MERMPIWQIALRRIEMPVPRFLSLYVAPIVVATFLISIVLVYLTGGLAEGALFSGFTGVFLVILLTTMSALAAMLFPVLEVQRSATLIEEEMHMFITRMGILSIGEVGAQSIFDILKQMRDYGELASEVKRIETLVDKWNTSLPEAARIVAHQSPSPLWSDFLDRMAFSIEAGQPIDEFMRSEQETIAEQYNTLYDTRLESVDTLKEIYVSLTTAGLFGLVIAGIHLVLFEVGGVNDTPIEVASRLRYLLLASLVFLFIQVVAVFAFRATIPKDATFARDEMDTPFRINFRRSLLLSGIVSIGLVVLATLTLIATRGGSNSTARRNLPRLHSSFGRHCTSSFGRTFCNHQGPAWHRLWYARQLDRSTGKAPLDPNRFRPSVGLFHRRHELRRHFSIHPHLHRRVAIFGSTRRNR